MPEAHAGGLVWPQSRYSEEPADVAQLVEHFTRNEGVRGSSPRVGFVTAIPFVSTRTVRTDVYVCPLCVSALHGTLGNTSASGFTLTL